MSTLGLLASFPLGGTMKIGWKLWADEVVSAWTVRGEPGTVYVDPRPPVGCPMSSWPSPLRLTLVTEGMPS